MKAAKEVLCQPMPRLHRVHVFQFTDASWLPTLWGRLVHEFLIWFIGGARAAHPFRPYLETALAAAKEQRIIDIHTGAGSGICELADELQINVPIVKARLEDEPWQERGVLVLANGFHRLRPEAALRLLREATQQRCTLLILEGNNDNWWQAVGMLVFAPLSALLTTPLVRPFRFSRLVFTYLIPVLPFLIAFDGMAALFKLYAPADLDALWGQLGVDNYEWSSGKSANGRGGKIIYALAVPSSSSSKT